MKILFFEDFRLGVIKGRGATEQVVDVTDAVADLSSLRPQEMIREVIERFGDYRERLESAARRGRGVPADAVRIRPPLPHPSNIVCMAVNYMEDGTLEEAPPINAFLKSPASIIGHGDTMVLPDVPAGAFEGEAELGVVIGRRASHVKAEDAMEYIFGYVNLIDGSARGLPPPTNVFYQMKSRDTFAPLGPYVVTADEIPDPQNLAVRLWVNGELKQSFSTDDMAHRISRCIEWVSSIHTLEPGDVVATGTNHRGLSCLQDGDTVELECDGCGRLRISVKDDLKRAWGRDTRLEHAAKGLPGRFTPQISGKYSEK